MWLLLQISPHSQIEGNLPYSDLQALNTISVEIEVQNADTCAAVPTKTEQLIFVCRYEKHLFPFTLSTSNIHNSPFVEYLVLSFGLSLSLRPFIWWKEVAVALLGCWDMRYLDEWPLVAVSEQAVRVLTQIVTKHRLDLCDKYGGEQTWPDRGDILSKRKFNLVS